MKKLLVLLLSALLALSCVGCGGQEAGAKSGSASPAAQGEADVDLTQLSNVMVYSEVCNLLNYPDDYMGKTVKMKGVFYVFHDDQTGKDYFSCNVADSTACCMQGLEFVLAGDCQYPDDYPEQEETITVMGTYGTYEENGSLFCCLTDAVIL